MPSYHDIKTENVGALKNVAQNKQQNGMLIHTIIHSMLLFTGFTNK